MKKTLITGFFLFLFSFSATFVAIMLLVADHQSHLIISGMENIAPVSLEQKFVFYKLTAEGENHFLAIGFYVFMTGFMAALFFGKKFLKAVKDLHSAAVTINAAPERIGMATSRIGMDSPAVNPDADPLDAVQYICATESASGAGELAEIACAMNRLLRTLRDKEEALALKNRYVSMMLDALWVMDEENLVTDINPAFTELLGYERDDIIGFPVFDFMDEKSERALRRHLLSCEDGACSSSELMLISKNGETVAVMASWSPLPAKANKNKNSVGKSKGETAGRLGILKDFRQEAGFRETLREAAEFQQAFMDSMPEIFMVANEGLNIIMSNKAAKNETGTDPAGAPYTSVCDPEGTCASLNCPVKMVFKTGRPQKEHAMPMKNRAQVPSLYEATAYPIKNRRGIVKNAAVMIRDITEQKRLRDEMDRKERELAALLDFSRIINSSLRGEDAFNPSMKKLVELTGMDGACVFLLDEMGVELSSKYHCGPLSGFFRENGTFQMDKMSGAGEDILCKAALGNPFTTADLSSDPRAEKSVLRQAGMRACAAFPMPGKEKMNGVLLLFSFSRHEWSVEDEDIIVHAVRMAGLSLENIRLYEKMRQLYNHLKWKKDGEQKGEE